MREPGEVGLDLSHRDHQSFGSAFAVGANSTLSRRCQDAVKSHHYAGMAVEPHQGEGVRALAAALACLVAL